MNQPNSFGRLNLFSGCRSGVMAVSDIDAAKGVATAVGPTQAPRDYDVRLRRSRASRLVVIFTSGAQTRRVL